MRKASRPGFGYTVGQRQLSQQQLHNYRQLESGSSQLNKDYMFAVPEGPAPRSTSQKQDGRPNMSQQQIYSSQSGLSAFNQNHSMQGPFGGSTNTMQSFGGSFSNQGTFNQGHGIGGGAGGADSVFTFSRQDMEQDIRDNRMSQQFLGGGGGGGYRQVEYRAQRSGAGFGDTHNRNTPPKKDDLIPMDEMSGGEEEEQDWAGQAGLQKGESPRGRKDTDPPVLPRKEEARKIPVVVRNLKDAWALPWARGSSPPGAARNRLEAGRGRPRDYKTSTRSREWKKRPRSRSREKKRGEEEQNKKKKGETTAGKTKKEGPPADKKPAEEEKEEPDELFDGKVKIKCPHCSFSTMDKKDYESHLTKNVHKAGMKKVKDQLDDVLKEMRRKQRDVQRRMEKSVLKDGQMIFKAKKYCITCDVHFFVKQTLHDDTFLHKKIQEFLQPRCKVCDEPFKDPLSYESHICLLVHIKKKLLSGRDLEAVKNQLKEQSPKDSKPEVEANKTPQNTSSVTAEQKPAPGGDTANVSAVDGKKKEQEARAALKKSLPFIGKLRKIPVKKDYGIQSETEAKTKEKTAVAEASKEKASPEVIKQDQKEAQAVKKEEVVEKEVPVTKPEPVQQEVKPAAVTTESPEKSNRVNFKTSARFVEVVEMYYCELCKTYCISGADFTSSKAMMKHCLTKVHRQKLMRRAKLLLRKNYLEKLRAKKEEVEEGIEQQEAEAAPETNQPTID